MVSVNKIMPKLPQPVSYKLLSEVNELAAASAIAVAVSGGADSMALLLLAQDWAQAHNKKIVALTINHGLRAESAQEANTVHGWCNMREIPHIILTWSPPALTSAIQAQARQARYQLLTDWCEENQIQHVLTAHHRDDQAETFFFRLARGSGLDGLACMQPAVKTSSGVTLIRPLLGVSKQQLIDILHERNQPWIEDPSNQNTNYTRNRIRALITVSTNPNDISERAYKLSQSLSRLRQALEDKTDEKMAACISYATDGAASIDAALFRTLEREYGLRILAAIAQEIGGAEHKPRTEKLERFYMQLCMDIDTGSLKKRTFSRCLFLPNPKNAVILVKTEK